MLKRDIVKYVRDRAKSRYAKGSECYICGTTELLEFHHFYGLTELLSKWMRKNKYKPEQIVEVRDDFIAEHEYELYEAAITLCKEHHRELHSVYGKRPRLSTAGKQQRWVERKHAAISTEEGKA